MLQLRADLCSPTKGGSPQVAAFAGVRGWQCRSRSRNCLWSMPMLAEVVHHLPSTASVRVTQGEKISHVLTCLTAGHVRSQPGQLQARICINKAKLWLHLQRFSYLSVFHSGSLSIDVLQCGLQIDGSQQAVLGWCTGRLRLLKMSMVLSCSHGTCCGPRDMSTICARNL